MATAKNKFTVRDLTGGYDGSNAAVFAGSNHIVSTQTRHAAVGIAHLLNEAAGIDAPPQQMVWALAKSLGINIRIDN